MVQRYMSATQIQQEILFRLNVRILHVNYRLQKFLIPSQAMLLVHFVLVT
ncbi:MAG: hypothetical protein ACD_42C00528G0001 [uncultured bacterium]|nr:MAG: hypothetical protein ACD_42C00528G0001 [uncultured bacterium]